MSALFNISHRLFAAAVAESAPRRQRPNAAGRTLTVTERPVARPLPTRPPTAAGGWPQFNFALK